ncbi:cystathionine beta-lyase [Salipiger abyssi]|uniref:cystathionine beta-lyase n=1 Tax=Salipiger abyssi TaxID=1250539 RepID=UPI004059C890
MAKPKPAALNPTKLIQAGRPEGGDGQPVNPPVVRASTFSFRSMEAFNATAATPFDAPFYGRVGTPTSFAFESAMAELEGAHRAIAYPSGLGAIMAVYMAYLSAGDHVLMVDSVYGPARRSMVRTMAQMGVSVDFYDPSIGAGIEALIGPETRLIYMESPGSGTFEVMDVPAIATVARKHGIVTAIDNTWATPHYFRPLEHGVDVSVHAATKYITGHSDAMLGVVAVSEAAHDALRRATQDLGMVAGSEEVNLGLRGLHTLDVRLARHDANGRALATWLEMRPETGRILHPAHPDCTGHEIWKRDFAGASGLFAVELPGWDEARINAFLRGMDCFRIGFSWGGYESLALPAHPESREHPKWKGGPVLRFHAGLEDPADLIADLDRAFARAAAEA